MVDTWRDRRLGCDIASQLAMKLNEKVLVELGSPESPTKVTKTGLLWMSEGRPGPKKQRWLVLKGNMLFYFRDPKGQEILGCIVVEKLALKIIDDRTFEFKLEFDASVQQDYFFQAETKSDFDHWQDLLKTCSYEYNSALQVILELRSKGISYPACLKTYNDGTYAQRRAVLDYRANLTELPKKDTFRSGNNVALRISLSAAELTGPSFVVSSAYIQVQVKYLTWFNYHRTEVRRSMNPVFEEPAVFNFDYSLTTKMNKTQLRFIVYHDSGDNGSMQDGDSSADVSGFTPFGVAECFIQDITQAQSDSGDHGCVQLPLLDSNDQTQKSAGVVKLEVKDLIPVDQLQRSGTSARKGKVARLGAKIEGPIFRFSTTEREEVRAREVMGESAYFQIVPSKLLEIYTKEDTEEIRELQGLDSVLSRSDWDTIVRPVFDYLLKRQALYHSHTAMLDSHQGSTFRASVDKKSKTMEMTAINCHIQRLEVLDKNDNVEAMYDVITHGAMAAHSLKYKNGGLRRILKEQTETRWISYQQDCFACKQQLLRIQDIIDSTSEKLEKSFNAAIKPSSNAPPPEFHWIDGEKKVTFSRHECHLIQQARISGSERVVIGCNVDEVGANQDIEVRFGVHAVSSTWTAAPSSCMLRVNLVTNASHRVEQSPSRVSEENLKDIDKLIGMVEFLLSFFKGDSQRGLIDKALADTLDLRMRGAGGWEIINNMNSLATNPFLTGDDDDDGMQSEADNVELDEEDRDFEAIPRRKISLKADGYNQPRSRIQLLAEINLAMKELASRKSEPITSIIPLVQDLRRTSNTAINDIKNGMLIKELQMRGDFLDEIEHRRDVTFSQACTILVTAFVSSLRLHSKNQLFLNQLSSIGYLAQFESLLSTHGNEMGMIEDMAQAICDLKRVTFKLGCAADDSQAFQYLVVSGRRYEICFEIMIHKSFFERLPESLKDGEPIEVVPIFFSHGVNEFQTIANKIGETQLQDEIVEKGFRDLVNYAKAFKMNVCPRMRHQNAATQDIDFCIAQLDKAIRQKKAKNIEILIAAQKVVRKMCGGRLTCCKSGKDRTGMSVTLEQCKVLIEKHKMDPNNLQNALDVMRSIGTRIDNVEKNIGERKYAFNKLQIYTLPKLLRPPLMSIGSQVT